MLRSDQYKYILYDAGENREQLIDLEKEPWEMKNFATNPAYREIIEEYRECFQSHRDMATNRALRWT